MGNGNGQSNGHRQAAAAGRADTGPVGGIVERRKQNRRASDGPPVLSPEVREQLDAAERLRQMIDTAPINVMYTDLQGTIQYVNKTSVETLRKLEAYLPLRADELVGKSFDVFHKNPIHQRRMIADPKNLPHRAVISLGPEKLQLLVSPIFDTMGGYVGAMLTWEVVTQRIATELALKEQQERERSAVEELRGKVDAILRVVAAAANGDLTQEIPVSGSDAIGQLGDGLGRFLRDLRQSVGGIVKNAQTLGIAADELSAVGHQMTASSDTTSSQADAASAAAEQVSRNVQTVATSTEEMSASIREIAKNAAEAARVATSAVGKAAATNTTIGKLGESSAEIGKVIKVITSIAQQTNLLALNATIEAARAGEAGKGFAVVANEVKELAKETAKATEDISQKIEAIQSDTRAAVTALGEISAVINQINDIQSTIASAVEEQTATTNEMSRNVAEGAKGTGEIARTIVVVAGAARETAQGVSKSQEAARSLARMSAELQRLVAQFRF
jgi:methyl-accepting chemotaxis protein